MSAQIELYQVPITHQTPRSIKDDYTFCLLDPNIEDIEFKRLVEGKHYRKTAVISVDDGTSMEQINQAFAISNEPDIKRLVIHHPHCRAASVGDIFATVGSGVGSLIPGVEFKKDDHHEFFLIQGIGFTNVTNFVEEYLL